MLSLLRDIFTLAVEQLTGDIRTPLFDTDAYELLAMDVRAA